MNLKVNKTYFKEHDKTIETIRKCSDVIIFV